MTGIITSLANFFTIHQNDRSAWINMLVTILIHENLTVHTCWIERINSLKVTDLMKADIEALMEMHENAGNSWNRDTIT